MIPHILDTPIEYLKGVGPARGQLLRKELNIYTFRDLLLYYPFRYVDKSKFFKVNEINSDLSFIQLKGKISQMQVVGGQRAKRLTALFTDDTGSIELVWFKGIRWFKDKFNPETEYVVFGKPAIYNNRYNIPHPDIDPATSDKDPIGNTLEGYYSTTEILKSKGLSSKSISKLLRTLLIKVKGQIPENLNEHILKHLSLPDRESALFSIHFPENQQILSKAEARLKFEELFFIQLRLLVYKVNRKKQSKGFVFAQVGQLLNRFYSEKLPFELTSAQKKVIKEIRADLGSGIQMNRLLQGDVGSGKTIVALMSALIAMDNGFQVCLMAPTEILANQHFISISRMLEDIDVQINLLTGSVKTSRRLTIHEQLENGMLNLLIGTHALIEEKVQFKNLGLVIIDEQHRFGVEQRARLWTKSDIAPHILVMTATPIPRTLAMTLYGDLDISVIDELPPGRKPVKTFHYYDSARLKLFGFMREQIRQGRQIYIVYPLIKESEKLDLKDLMDGYESIQRSFPLPEYAISIVHGKMKSADKEYEMQRFIRQETQIMVATTVIEVGVDIPNASVMIIESAERFGLSQLHQLRGRVGRGADQSYCILMTHENLSHEARKRIQTMVRTNDGFEIAEADLRLRGPGDLQGTRQSGMLDLKIANIVKDEKILKYARSTAIDILDKDPDLSGKENKPVAEYLSLLNKSAPMWERIS
ncbi:MAG: ATP-dependent DNA helicase RecG [Bacteroidetes bacterium]|nr:ATP-dependent DNA helicase RecG [Bacteroidota bacterium]